MGLDADSWISTKEGGGSSSLPRVIRHTSVIACVSVFVLAPTRPARRPIPRPPARTMSRRSTPIFIACGVACMVLLVFAVRVVREENKLR